MPHQQRAVAIDSRALGQSMPATVLVPSRPAPRDGYPVLYLLHGGFSHHAEWAEQVPLAQYAAPFDFAIVMPEGESSMYVNGHDGRRFADYVLDDVPAWAEAKLRVRRDPEGRALAGLSMGGFGAMNLGLSQASRFAALGSLSGAFGMTWWNLGKHPGSPFLPAFGPEGSEERERNHPWRVLDAVAAQQPKRWPRIALWVGTGDDPDLLESNRAYHRRLDELGIAHRYRESPGGHDWDYWNRITPELLQFVAGAFGLSEPLDG